MGIFCVFREYQLRSHSLAGGRESSLISALDPWLVEHYLVAAKAVVGLGNGTNIDFDSSGMVRVPVLGVFGTIWFVALTLLVLVFFTFIATRPRGVPTPDSETTSNSRDHQTIMWQLLLSCGLLLIIPASTTINRIEMSWLFGPEVFIFMFTVVALRSEKWRTIFITSFLLFNVVCLKFLPDYEHPMALSNEVLEYVHEKLEGRTELVYTVVDPRGRPELVKWIDSALGVDYKFKEVGVKSTSYVDNRLCRGSCIRLVFADTARYKLVRS